MIQDAREQIKSPKELRLKEDHIKLFQVLGIELRPDIYMLAVLNMILMGDGSSHILNEDSLQYNGKYNQAIKDEKDKDFPANVFLLNPPYSAPGSGLIFVEKALDKMSSGYAAVLIKENVGAGHAKDYAQRILKHSTLLASIHMSEKLFIGKASVQTAIYLFEVGHPHNVQQKVKFINFAEDGYKRANRKKASKSVNLSDNDHAKERYDEVVNLILNRTVTHAYLKPENYIEDTISLKGDDWTYSKHKKTDTIPTHDDFAKVVNDYLAWRVGEVIKSDGHFRNAQTMGFRDCSLNAKEQDALNAIQTKNKSFKTIRVGELFDIHPTISYRQTNKTLFATTGNVPVIVNSSRENGIGSWVALKATENGNMITYSDTTTSDAVFYQPIDFIGYSHVQGLYPYEPKNWNENTYLYFLTLFRKSASGRFDYATKFTRYIAMGMEVSVPIDDNGSIDYIFMENLINSIKKQAFTRVINYIEKEHDERSNDSREELKITPLIHPEYKPGFIPLHTIRAACGYFGEGRLPEEEGWIDASGLGFTPDPKRHFAVHAKGDSMQPKIKDGDICIFEWYIAGSRNGEIVLTQSSEYDSEYGGRYTIKRYHSEKIVTDEGWQHSKVELQPLNPDFDPIELSEDDDVRTIGIFKCVL